MWGCISLLYVSHMRADGSLTVCEGVSCPERFSLPLEEFPHCMWGCIVTERKERQDFMVPSLYVRVYRYKTATMRRCFGSLTICEGVSAIEISLLMCLMFPHYTWGCIAPFGLLCNNTPVPSLYVRVYRLLSAIFSRFGRSLIIREGVSTNRTAQQCKNEFPHYTWGCIAWTDEELQELCSSLTIREGVSRRQIVGKTEAEFPHYTWGYIKQPIFYIGCFLFFNTYKKYFIFSILNINKEK